MKEYTAFFDLDNTILSTSSGKMLIRFLREHGLISKWGLFRIFSIMWLYRTGMVNPDRAMDMISMMYRGVYEASIIRQAEELFEEYLKNRIRKDAEKEIKFHREQGGSTVILSASTSHICRTVMDHLGMDGMLCTVMDVRDSRLTGKTVDGYCHGEEKLRRALAWCKERGQSLDDAYYYADALADLPALESVGHPRCVTPDERLREIAEEREWQICEWI